MNPIQLSKGHLEDMRRIADAIEKQADDLLHHQEDDKVSFGGIERTLQSMHDMLRNHDTTFAEMKRTLDQLAEDSEPVNQWFKNVTFSKSALVWIVGLVGGIVAIAIGIRNLFDR